MQLGLYYVATLVPVRRRQQEMGVQLAPLAVVIPEAALALRAVAIPEAALAPRVAVIPEAALAPQVAVIPAVAPPVVLVRQQLHRLRRNRFFKCAKKPAKRLLETSQIGLRPRKRVFEPPIHFLPAD